MSDGPIFGWTRTKARGAIGDSASETSQEYRSGIGSSPLRVAVVGLGGVAQRFHLPALRRLAASRIVAIADSDPDALELGKSFAPDAMAYSDWREALGQPDVQAVVVCLPSQMHAPTAIECLRCDKHLYLEKPIALTLEDAQQVVACAERREVTAQIGFNYRFHPMVDTACSMITRGELGRVLAVNSVVANRPNLTGWRGQKGGGALVDLAVHHIDLARFILADEFTDVSATGHTSDCGRETVLLTTRMRQGVLASIVASNAAKRLDQFFIIGENTSICLDRFASTARLMHRSRHGSWREERVASALELALSAGKTALSAAQPIPDPSFYLALEAFVDTALHGGSPRGPSLADGLEAIRLITDATLTLDESR